jgi:hypothetical protein
MAYQLTFERHPDYLHATVTGSNDQDAVMQYLREIRAECQRQGCFRVLIDEKLAGPRLAVDEVFTIASEGAMDAMGIFEAIAYVDPYMGPMAEFAETVAVNRGMPVRTFDSVDAAREWLLEQVGKPVGQHIFTGEDDPQR